LSTSPTWNAVFIWRTQLFLNGLVVPYKTTEDQYRQFLQVAPLEIAATVLARQGEWKFSVVVGVIWRLLYASDIGVVDPLFQALGLDAPHVLAKPVTAFLALVVVDVWEWTPLLFLIILAGLQSMPQDPIEAARVDGASGWQTFFHHTLPLLRPVLLVAVVLRTIDAVGTFDQVFVLTKGGPGTATQLISIYAYNTAFLFNQYGRAMAMLIGVLAFLIVLMTAAVRLMRQTSERIE